MSVCESDSPFEKLLVFEEVKNEAAPIFNKSISNLSAFNYIHILIRIRISYKIHFYQVR